jgi:hypothetical protein
MTCKKCGSKKVRMMGQVILSAPIDFYGNLSKTNLKKKEVYLLGAIWETFDFICCNPKCRHVESAYGTYVSNLKKENEQLKQRINALTNRCENKKGDNNV